MLASEVSGLRGQAIVLAALGSVKALGYVVYAHIPSVKPAPRRIATVQCVCDQALGRLAASASGAV